jgi:hypothetical protein
VEAAKALFDAVKGNNEQAIANILGGPTELASSGEAAQDKADREMFVQKYVEMHRLGRDADGSETLYIGAGNWPFPIPLVEKDAAWHFDPEAGRKEVMFRRIGENELTAIVICHELVAAKKHVNQADTLLASLISPTPSAEPVLIHGYYFRTLPKHRPDGKIPGGFAFIAYPSEYRSSGVMTFMITEKNIVKEKDLGTDTLTLARALGWSDKELGWVQADERNNKGDK